MFVLKILSLHHEKYCSRICTINGSKNWDTCHWARFGYCSASTHKN